MMCINYISKINKLNEDLSKIKIRSYECIHYLYKNHRKLDKEEKQKLEKSIQSIAKYMILFRVLTEKKVTLQNVLQFVQMMKLPTLA